MIITIISGNKIDGSRGPSQSPKIIIPDDYFIYAEYFLYQSESIKLISDEYDINKIKNMSIDGNITKPTKTFTFNRNGKHSVYYSFNPLNDKLYYQKEDSFLMVL